MRVQLPPLDTSKRDEFKKRFVASGSLEFRLVDDEDGLIQRIAAANKLGPGISLKTDEYDGLKRGKVKHFCLVSKDRTPLVSYVGSLTGDFVPRPNREILFGEERDYEKQEGIFKTYLVHRQPLLSGKHVRSSVVEMDKETMRPEVGLTFTAEGAKLFEAVTTRYLGYRIAIVLKGQVNSAPVVVSPIKGGRARITLGGFKDPLSLMREARDLVSALQVGALPARIRLVRSETF